MKFSSLNIVIFLIVFSGCHTATETLIIDASNINLKLDNGVLFFNNIPFEGTLVTYYPTSELKSEIQYADGKKNGYEKQWDKAGWKQPEYGASSVEEIKAGGRYFPSVSVENDESRHNSAIEFL